MRRRVVYDRNGDVVDPKDVLSDAELDEYYGMHPRPRTHQMHFYPDYAAEEYERFQCEKDSE